MKISQISRHTGLSIHTLRYYEKLGLFPKKFILRRDNNYREYDKKILDVIRVIVYAKSAGFNLKEIKKHLEVYNDGDMNDENKIRILERKKVDIEQKIREIQFVRDMISEKISLLKNKQKKNKT